MQVLPDNKLFVHSEKTTKFWDIGQRKFLSAEFETKTGGTRTYPGMGSCVLLPLQYNSKTAKIMLVGGSTSMSPNKNDDAASIPEILTVDLANPANSVDWQAKPPHHKRFLCDSVILPDGKILVTNGAEKGTADHNQIAVMKIELFDPENETWKVIGELKKPRLYHSTAILLADGSVLVAGSTGHDFPRAIFNPAKHFEQEIEIIRPPYFDNSTRPKIVGELQSLPYNTTFQITTDVQNIDKVSIIRLSSTTHNNNMDQRCLFLNIAEKSGTTIKLQSPKDGSWAPPGPYMLFVVDDKGVPSTGKFIKIS